MVTSFTVQVVAPTKLPRLAVRTLLSSTTRRASRPGHWEITSGAAANHAENSNDEIFLGASGTVSGDLTDRIDYTANGVSQTSIDATIGRSPAFVEQTRVTRVDIQAVVELSLEGLNTVSAGKHTYDGNSINVTGSYVQAAGNPNDNRIVFWTNNFEQARGSTIRSSGDVMFVARDEDRRWTSGFYKIEELISF